MITRKIAIIGFGGQAREIACNLAKKYDFFIHRKFINPTTPSYVKILEDICLDNYQVLIAIGSSDIRKKISQELPSSTEYYTYIDKNAILMDSETIRIGKGSIICAGTILTTNIKIGQFVNLNLNTTVAHDSTIGNLTTTSSGVHISGNVLIGNECFLGVGSAIREGVTIVDRVTIGMNSVVNKNIDQPGVYVGMPVKLLKPV